MNELIIMKPSPSREQFVIPVKPSVCRGIQNRLSQAGDKSSMTERQSFALNNVIADLGQVKTVRQYTKVIARGPLRFGTILTVDVHPKGVFWHVCVSLINSVAKPIELDYLSSTEKAANIRVAEELLSDVGQSDSDYVHEEKSSVHLIRQLTIQEVQLAKVYISRPPK